MAITPRSAKFTSKSQDSDFVNNMSFNGLDGDVVLTEPPVPLPPFPFVDVNFDPTANVGFLFANGIGDLTSARVQLWSDNNNNGVIDVGDTPSVPNAVLTDLTWQQVLDASGDGANDVILAIDDDGNVSDGDFDDLIIAGDIVPPTEEPPQEECLVSEVKLTTVYEDSDYFNTLSIAGNETVAGETPITEELGDTATIRFDALDNAPGDFFLNTANDGSTSRVKLFSDTNNSDQYEFGVDTPIEGSDKLVNALTWKDLADAWANNGQQDLLIAIDDDGNSSDGDFNDIVLLAQFTPPVCEEECPPVEECVVTEATLKSVYQESDYFNTLQISRGETIVASIDETIGDSEVVNFDGSEVFSLLTGNDGLAASVKLYVDNGNGEYDFGVDEYVEGSLQLLSALTWDDLLGASANGTKNLLIAIDDDGNTSDGDFNDIVLLFQPTPCEDYVPCDCTYGVEETGLIPL